MNRKMFRSIAMLLLIAAVLTLAVAKLDLLMLGVGALLAVLSPLLFGILIALILQRPFQFFRKGFLRLFRNANRKIGLATGLSIAVTYLLLLAFIAVFILSVIPGLTSSVSVLTENIGTYIENAEDAINGFLQSHEILRKHIEPVDFSGGEGMLTGFISRLLDYLRSRLPALFNLTKSIALGITNAVLSVMVSIYILFDRDHLVWQAKKTVYAFLAPKTADKIRDISRLSVTTFTDFISGRIIDSAIIGVLCFLCLTLFGFEYATLISFIVGITNIIPLFGPFIGAIPSALLLLLVNPKHCFWFIVFILVLQQLDGNVIGPKVVGQAIGLPSLWVLVGITVGGGLFGMMGLILGVPVCAVVYTLLRDLVAANAEKKGIALDDAPPKDAFREPKHRIRKTLARLRERFGRKK